MITNIGENVGRLFKNSNNSVFEKTPSLLPQWQRSNSMRYVGNMRGMKCMTTVVRSRWCFTGRQSESPSHL